MKTKEASNSILKAVVVLVLISIMVVAFVYNIG
jgi:hypothetical protein